jgi:large subunit ribosomal protein L13
MRQTTFAKSSELEKRWHHVDASGQRLGRMASEIAVVLMGKHRPDYTPHIDTGDFVIVTNAAAVEMTGKKLDHKMRTTFSGYPSGLRAESYRSLRERRPEFLVEEAVRRMLPKGRLGRSMLKKLKVYAGPDHPHQSQQPTPLAVSN